MSGNPVNCPYCMENADIRKVETVSGCSHIHVLFYYWCGACNNVFCVLNLFEK